MLAFHKIFSPFSPINPNLNKNSNSGPERVGAIRSFSAELFHLIGEQYSNAERGPFAIIHPGSDSNHES